MPEPRDYRKAKRLETQCSVGETVIEGFQRKILNRLRIKKIKADFSWVSFGRPVAYILSLDPPLYSIIDGQHRVTAVREMWGESIEIPILIVDKPEYTERAEMFVQTDENRTKLHPLDKFNAELEAQRAEAVGINDIAQSVGARVGQRGGGSGADVVGAITSLKTAYRYGPDVLERTLIILREVWEHDAGRHLAVNIVGVSMLLNTYPPIKDKRVIERLRILSDKAGGGRAIQRGVVAIQGYTTPTNSVGRAAAAVVARAYNTRLSAANRLDLSKLLPED
jgi:hypothetical protein